MSFDLASLALKETHELQLKHPATDEPLFDGDKPVAIMIYGSASKQYRNTINAMQNRALRRNAQGKKATAEEIRKEGLDLLVACSDKAVNLTYEGDVVDSPEMFRELYSDPRFSWVREQVDAALGNPANFLDQ